MPSRAWTGWLMLISVASFLWLIPLNAQAQTGLTETWQQEVEQVIDRGEIEQYWEELKRDYGGFMPETDRQSHGRFSDSNAGSRPMHWLMGFVRFFLYEITVNGKLLLTLSILTIFCMVLEAVQSAFERQTVSRLAQTICMLVLLFVTINSFHVAVQYAADAISTMMHFMIAILPLLMTLLASMGHVLTVSVMHPLIVAMTQIIGGLVHGLVFPLLYASAILYLTSALHPRYQLTRFADLLRNLAMGILAVGMTIFLGVLSVRGATTAVTDGLAIRTAKYVTGNFVPVVGRMFTDAADTVMGASLLIKNAIGLSGVLVIVMICVFPALKILVLAFIYQLCAALLQPLGDHPITALLRTMSRLLLYVFAALACVALMFFLSITVLIAAGNAAIMMR